ncbi:unnamed protein product [Auanema sp. JU1783]|nr:unnamed protein product [Auanema sp. JU1783]
MYAQTTSIFFYIFTVQTWSRRTYRRMMKEVQRPTAISLRTDLPLEPNEIQTKNDEPEDPHRLAILNFVQDITSNSLTMPDESASPTSPRTSSETPTDEENSISENGIRDINKIFDDHTTIDPNAGKVIEIKCGPLYAKMHLELFRCPGIHQACIELNGEMISPKEFTVRANKDKQKDWKGSIRIGKSNLRTLMEMRTFDFYNHAQLCSAKCQSRNYITPKEKDCESRRGSSASQKAAPVFPNLFSNQFMGQAQCNLNIFKEASTFTQLMQWNNVLNNNNQQLNGTFKSEVKEEVVDVDDSLTESPQIPVMLPPEQYLRMMNTDPPVFWTEMSQMNILDDIIDQMVQSLYRIRDTSKMFGTSNVASSLTRVASSLNIGDSIINLITDKQIQKRLNIQMEKPRLSSDYSCLEDTDRKRSIDESSQSSSNSQSSPEVKRPRVQYPNGLSQSEAPDLNLLQALVNAQMQLGQQSSMDLLLSLTTPLSFGDSLLALKREQNNSV